MRRATARPRSPPARLTTGASQLNTAIAAAEQEVDRLSSLADGAEALMPNATDVCVCAIGPLRPPVEGALPLSSVGFRVQERAPLSGLDYTE